MARSTAKLKSRLMQTLVWPVATYGCESWTIKASDSNRLTAFEMDILKDDENKLDRAQNQQVYIRGIEADTSFPGRSKKKEIAILRPYSLS